MVESAHPTEDYTMYKMSSQTKEPPLLVTVSINGSPVTMEKDTDASVSVPNENHLSRSWLQF